MYARLREAGIVHPLSRISADERHTRLGIFGGRGDSNLPPCHLGPVYADGASRFVAALALDPGARVMTWSYERASWLERGDMAVWEAHVPYSIGADKARDGCAIAWTTFASLPPPTEATGAENCNAIYPP